MLKDSWILSDKPDPSRMTSEFPQFLNQPSQPVESAQFYPSTAFVLAQGSSLEKYLPDYFVYKFVKENWLMKQLVHLARYRGSTHGLQQHFWSLTELPRYLQPCLKPFDLETLRAIWIYHATVICVWDPFLMRCLSFSSTFHRYLALILSPFEIWTLI